MRNYYLYCLLTLVSLTGFVTANAQFPAPYCGEAFASSIEPITKVVFAGINNTTSATVNGTPAHENFTAITGNVLMGQSYTIEVQGNTDGNFTTHVRLFVDWNNDGDFVDAGETFVVGTIVNSTGVDGQTASASIAIPLTATPGNLRMRVSKRFSTVPAPCNTAGFGQAEDYTLTVTPPTPCAGIPNAGTATATPSPICLGQPISLSVTGSTLAAGLAYQWQVSTTSATTGFTDIAGATSLSATTTQNVTSWYQLKVTCTATNDIAYSNAVQVVSPPVPGGTYTIGGGPTTWNIPAGAGNTSGTNFATFQEAIAAMSCGISSSVVFNVVNATYNTQVIIPNILNTDATRTVTFNGNGATLTFATTAAERAVIKLNAANFIRINDFVINPTGTNAYGIQLINDADSNIIRNNTINLSLTSTANTVAGIVMSGSATDAIGTGTTTALHAFNEIRNNTINGGFYGITLAATPAGGANINNTIYGNTIRDFHQYGIYVAGSGNTIIDSNQISRPNRTVTASTVEGIYFTTQSNNARITRNRITNPFGGLASRATAAFNGISFNSASASAGNDNIATNNLIGDITNTNGTIYALSNSSSSSVSYFHNTIALDDAAAVNGTTRGLSVTGTADGVILYNNMISITRGGNGQKHGIYLGGSLLLGSDYNNVYVNATNGHFGFYGGNRTTLQNWQAATSAANLDANSFAANPVFLNPATGDFCSANAGIDNQALYIGIDNDINNNVRSFTTPDIGAFECTPPACTIPVITGATVVTPTTICEGLPVLLNLNIGAYGSGQTFQWQWSPDNIQPYVNLGDPKQTPDTIITASTTMWVRAMVNCATSTEYSTPVLLTVDPAFPGGFYTINKTLPTTYTGPNTGFNFNSFNDAYNAMAACGITGGPVVFDVVAGTGPYEERLKMDSIRNVNEINTITFNGNDNVITFGAAAPHLPTSADRAVIKLTRLDHVTFNDLVIDASNGASFGYGVQLHNDADSNTFRNCTIITSTTSTSNAYAGVVINGTDAGPVSTGNTFCNGNRFEGNTITGGFYGVTVVGGSNPAQIIDGNKFLSNTVQEFYSTGFYISGTSNTIIDSNTITRPTRTTFAATTGIFSTGIANNGLIISRNRIRNLAGGNPATTVQQYGIYHNIDQAASTPSIVTNNLISDLGGNGIIYGLYNVGSDNVHYYHNTVSLDSNASYITTSGATRGYFQQSVATGIEFKNNIVTIKRGGTGAKHAIYLDNTTTDIVSNYNDFYVNATNAHIGFLTANRTTLADWQTASTEDANSLNEDPLYQNPAAADYRPSIQTVDNLGTTSTSVPVTIDILGVARSATPDMGAFEFSALPCATPPVAGTATATPSSNICLQDPVELNITGHSPLGTLTFQWFNGPTNAGPWTAISPIQYGPQFNTISSVNEWYRAEVVCNGNISYTNPVQVVLNPIVLAGEHTINPALPTSTPPWLPGSNFNSFQAAVDAMNCGIGGRVVFNVVPGTYNEQIRIGNIRNTDATNTVTFQSSTANAADVNLTYASTTAGSNYTLKLDSASYFRFYNITITASDAVYGRAVEFAGRASFDSLVGCNIVAPAVTNTSNNAAGIYATSLRGNNNVIKGNKVTNGAMGIYWFGTNAATPSFDHLIDSNTINGAYFYGIYANFQRNIVVQKNTVNVTAPLSATSYGIYLSDCDSSYNVLSNTVNINDAVTNAYGIYLTNNDKAATNGSALIHGNTVVAGTGNTSGIWGMYINNAAAATSHHDVLNNVISVNTTGTTSYGIYSNNVSNGRYYNNTVNSTSPNGTTTNAAVRFENSSATGLVVRNNIFSHKGGGRALYVQNSNDPSFLNYNMLYTSGAVLAQRTTPAGSFANLAAWRTASNNDKWSIVYEPAFVSNTDLKPDVASPDVWAMHGRGVQIVGNNYDFNRNYRPQALTEGVPDLGAFEFFPTSQPTVLTGTPAVPGPNMTQTFMYGTDTVIKVSWGAADFPSAITAQRYSGVQPGDGPYPNGTDSMFFYVKMNVPGGSPNNFKDSVNLFYLDPWQGSIADQNTIGLGRKSLQNSWVVGFSSRVDVNRKMITHFDIVNVDRYTGFINPYAPPVLPDKDSSNRGRRFWVAYGHHQQMSGTGGGSQNMRLYLSAQQAAYVKVKIYGTTWERYYQIPANTAIITDLMPKGGPEGDARLLNEGLYNTGIYIESDEPIEAYAHTYATTNSGASLLLPVGTYGYEYYSLNSTQIYASDCYSWFYVIADKDNTLVEITPSVTTRGGRPAGVPFQVVLNKGQVYQVMGTTSGANGTDVTGSLIKSIPNSDGECHPIAVFSGSSRTAICWDTNGDNYNQQVFPYSAWGKQYATFASANNTSSTNYNSNLIRVMVKDPTTQITYNGAAVPTSSLIDGRYYQFNTTAGVGGPLSSVYITADKPVMVGQYMVSSGAPDCPGVSAPGDGDPEMMYISPIEQGINKAVFYTTIQNTINTNYINIVIPDAGMASLTIDGNSTFTHVFNHPYLPGYKCVRHNLPATNAQHVVQSDVAFTAITYGLGAAESYGYNTGTLVRTLNAKGNISNTLNTSGTPNEFTCVGTPFTFSALVPVSPTKLTWKFGSVPNLSPGTDVVMNNPVPAGTTVINGVTYYIFNIATPYTFSNIGIYPVQIVYEHPDIEACDHTATDLIYVQVVPSPKTNFAIAFSGCEGDNATFTGELQTANGVNISGWEWTLPGGATTTGQGASYTFATPGTFDVKLHTTTPDGCIGDSTKQVVVNPRPVTTVVSDSIAVCLNTDATFNIQAPLAGATYSWYSTASGGTPLTSGAAYTISADGTTFTVHNVTGSANYYAEALSSSGCTSASRVEVEVELVTQFVQPVVTVSGSTASTVTFSWNAVPGATSYEVDVNNSGTWITPSSGATGLTHTVSGLGTLATATIQVRALGSLPCQTSTSAAVSGCANSSAAVAVATIEVCTGTGATFNIQNPVAGITYNWYDAATGGTLLGTGSTFTSPGVSGTTNYYVEQVSTTGLNCVGSPRTQVTATILAPLATPVVTVLPADISATSITFRWAAVTGASAYQVSIDNGATWTVPSSGSTGLFHLVSGLTPSQQVCLMVRVVGTIACQTSTSAVVCERSRPDAIFIPNTFTPNGDGKNDALVAYGWAIQTIQFMVFNQWGEKIHEVTSGSQDANGGFVIWDGKYQGKVQPVGVYAYVAKITQKDGTVVQKSGPLNIVR